MRSFKLAEISAVDSPAQAGATAVLMKRSDGDDSDQEPDSMRFEKITEQPISFDTLEEAIAHLREVYGLSKLDAMSAAADRHPDLVRKYNEAAVERVTPTPVVRIPTISADVVRFDDAVRNIMARDNCSKLVAMERAPREHPDLFRAYQAAGETPSDLGLRPRGAIPT